MNGALPCYKSVEQKRFFSKHLASCKTVEGNNCTDKCCC